MFREDEDEINVMEIQAKKYAERPGYQIAITIMRRPPHHKEGGDTLLQCNFYAPELPTIKVIEESSRKIPFKEEEDTTSEKEPKH